MLSACNDKNFVISFYYSKNRFKIHRQDRFQWLSRMSGLLQEPSEIIQVWIIGLDQFFQHRLPHQLQGLRRNRESFLEEAGTPPSSPFYHLRLAQAIWKAIRQRKISQQTIDYYLSIHSLASVGRIESESALRDTISQCKERDIPCIVVMFPLLYELSDDYPFTVIHQHIGQVVRQAGAGFIDLLPALKGLAAGTLIVHPTDQHPNEKVHAIAGRLVADEILRMSDSPLGP